MKFVLLISLFLASLSFAKPSKHVIKVAIIDTGLSIQSPAFSHICPSGHADFTDSSLSDTNGHGTIVADLIVQNAGNSSYCLLIYKYFLDTNTGRQDLINEVKSIKEAIKNGAEIINISGGGPVFNKEEYSVIKDNPKVTFIVAAGNEGHDITKEGYEFYPASYELDNIKVIGSLNNLNYPATFSNWSSRVDNFYWEPGTNITVTNDPKEYNGTSFSTAIFTGIQIRNLNVTK